MQTNALNTTTRPQTRRPIRIATMDDTLLLPLGCQGMELLGVQLMQPQQHPRRVRTRRLHRPACTAWTSGIDTVLSKREDKQVYVFAHDVRLRLYSVLGLPLNAGLNDIKQQLRMHGYFSKRFDDVKADLNVSASTLKRLCRLMKIWRWPRRKILAGLIV